MISKEFLVTHCSILALLLVLLGASWASSQVLRLIIAGVLWRWRIRPRKVFLELPFTALFFILFLGLRAAFGMEGKWSFVFLGLLVIVVVVVHSWSWQQLRCRQLENETFELLFGLEALVGAGFSFSESLYRLSSEQKNGLGKVLFRVLKEFESGASLERCSSLIIRALPDWSGEQWWRLAMFSFSKGVPLRPLLIDILKTYQFRYDLTQRVRTLRAQAVFQCLIASCVAWSLFFVLYFFQKEVVLGFFRSHSLAPLVTSFVLFLQGVGLVAVVRMTRVS